MIERISRFYEVDFGRTGKVISRETFFIPAQSDTLDLTPIIPLLCPHYAFSTEEEKRHYIGGLEVAVRFRTEDANVIQIARTNYPVPPLTMLLSRKDAINYSLFILQRQQPKEDDPIYLTGGFCVERQPRQVTSNVLHLVLAHWLSGLYRDCPNYDVRKQITADLTLVTTHLTRANA
ncbi:hypothetical protein HZB00_03885 [Candidatus Woesearchaeota archaeon]|nr:hypothetical protein [Candidatus Woesearchaeota archaeon]